MQQAATTADRATPRPDPEKSRRVMEGIARRLQLTASYNAMALRIAPHVLYERDGKLYVAGIVTERRGEPVQNVKLGVFKVDGLGDLAVSDIAFDVSREFDPGDPRFATTTVFSV